MLSGASIARRELHTRPARRAARTEATEARRPLGQSAAEPQAQSRAHAADLLSAKAEMTGVVVWPHKRLRFGVGFSWMRPLQFFARKLSSQHSYVVYLCVLGVMLTVSLSWYPPGYHA